jgi:hypothetical protein
MARVQTQGASSGTPRPKRAAACLFVSLAAIYVVLARGHITSVDEGHIYLTTEALAERRSWQMRERLNDRTVSRYSVLPSLAAVPFFWLGKLASGHPTEHPEPPADSRLTAAEICQAAATFHTCLVTAATAALLFWGLCRLGRPAGCALASALVFALATLALPYAGSLYVQPMTSLALLAAVVAWLLEQSMAAAVAWFLLLVLRVDLVLLGPVFGFHGWRFHARPGAGAVALMVATTAALATNGAVNWLRGDSIFWGSYGGEAFSTPAWIGLHGLLFSTGKGLCWFAPAAALGLALLIWLCQAEPRAGSLLGGCTALIVVMTACWWTWHGGWSWGARLLVPVMPLVSAPFAWWFERWQSMPIGRRAAVLALLIASTAIQVWSAGVNPVADRTSTWVHENEAIYVPSTGALAIPRDEPLDLFWAQVWQREPASRMWLSVLVGALIVAALGGLGMAIRAAAVTGRLRTLLGPGWSAGRVACVACMMTLVALPTGVERLLLPGRGAELPPGPSMLAARSQPGIGTTGQMGTRAHLPDPFRRLTRSADGAQWSGRLYAPIDGAYTFYYSARGNTGVAPGAVLLDGEVLVQASGFGMAVANRQLARGFHRLALPGGAVGQLLWTTPGNAHYKTPVPRHYVAGPQPDWRDRVLIAVHEWTWILWGAALVAWCMVGGGREPAASSALQRNGME